MHCTRLSYASEVIASEIDEHYVLGRFFGISEQRFFIRDIFCGCRPSWQCSCDGPQRCRTTVQLNERFGRRAYDLEITKLEKEHVRRRVQQPQRTVHLERRHVRAAAEQHRDYDLVDIA